MPEVEWECKCTGSAVSSRSCFTSSIGVAWA